MKNKFLLAILSSLLLLPLAAVNAQTDTSSPSSIAEGTKVEVFVAFSDGKTVIMGADRQVLAVITAQSGNPYALLPGVLYQADAVFYETEVELRNIIRSDAANAEEFLETIANIDPETLPAEAFRAPLFTNEWPLNPEYPPVPVLGDPDPDENDSSIIQPIVSPDA